MATIAKALPAQVLPRIESRAIFSHLLRSITRALALRATWQAFYGTTCSVDGDWPGLARELR